MNSEVSGKLEISSLPFFLYPENLEFLVGRTNRPVVEGKRPWRKLCGLTLLVFLIIFIFEIYWHQGLVNPVGIPFQIATLGAALALVFLFSYFRFRHRALLRGGQVLEGRVLAAGFMRDLNVVGAAGVPMPQGGELHIWVKYLFVSPSARSICEKEEVIQKDFKGFLPEPGTSVLVLYLNDKNFRML